MVRIETTTYAEVVFLSPFVFTLEEAKMKIRRLKSWHKLPSYKTVEVKRYPRIAKYIPNDFMDSNILNKVKQIEKAWQRV